MNKKVKLGGRKPHATILPKPASRAATVTEGEWAGARGRRALGVPVSEQERIEPDQLLQYEPPALPKQPESRLAMARTGAAAVRYFRVAEADEGLPPVAVTYNVRRRTWILLNDYSYVYEGHTLTAKAGYAFDLATVPRPIWWLIAPNELSIVAPLFHDLLYEFRGRLPDPSQVTPYRTYSRLETDDLFLHLLEREGVAWWRRMAAYSAVRAAGGLFWST